MKRSLSTFLLCFTLLTACSTQSTNQNTPPIEKFTLHVIGNNQVNFDGTVMAIAAFGDKLENLRFAKRALVKLNVSNTVTMGEITDVENILRENNLLRISYAQLN